MRTVRWMGRPKALATNPEFDPWDTYGELITSGCPLIATHVC